jgi:hypothetical protein
MERSLGLTPPSRTRLLAKVNVAWIEDGMDVLVGICLSSNAFLGATVPPPAWNWSREISNPSLARYAQRELQYQLRGEIARGIRKSCPKGDPMVTCITVMLGTVLAMAALDAILNRNADGRTR